MKSLYRFVTVCCLLFVAVSAVSAAQAKKQPLKLLMLVGGCCHDFKDDPQMLKTLLENTGDFKVVKITEDRSELAAPTVDQYDALIIYTQGSDLTPDQEKGVTNFVSNGKGFVGIHCASDSFKNSDAYWKMIGGRFTGHGSGEFTIRITGKRNPIVAGIENFQIRDEDYDNAIHPDAKLSVLARWGNDGQPAIWTQEYGKGRVFYTGMGHGKDAWENKSFQEIVLRGLRWSVGWEPVKPVNTASCTTSSAGSTCSTK